MLIKMEISGAGIRIPLTTVQYMSQAGNNTFNSGPELGCKYSSARALCSPILRITST